MRDRFELFLLEEKEEIKISRKKTVLFVSVLLVTLIFVVVGVQTSLHNINNTKISRVACIGDSITELMVEFRSYPTELQNMLGDSYRVGNFGTSGATVLFDTYVPYVHQTSFFRAKVFFPNIVVIMLGTNDARTDNFKSIDNFVSDYMKLINEIQTVKTNPQIFLVKPPPIFDNDLNLNGDNFLQEIIPRIEKIANETSLPIIDVYSAMEDHPEYFQDGVHPTSEATTIIATEVYNAIIDFY